MPQHDDNIGLCLNIPTPRLPDPTFPALAYALPLHQHAVGNTIKRVVIIVAACLTFRTPMTPLAITGSSVAIAGTLLYSLVKAKYEKKK